MMQMIREMRALFGEDMWDNLIVGVNKWPYSQADIDVRQYTALI